MEHDNENILTLMDEKGVELRFIHLDTIKTDDDKVYIVLAPADDLESDDLYIFRVISDEDGETVMEGIDDDDELELVYDIFMTKLESIEEEFLN